MPYWLESDTFAAEDVWMALAKRARGGRDMVDRLQAAYCRLKAGAALVRTDGYLTPERALEGCWGRRAVLELLCTPVLAQPALLHRKGDVCECLEETWRDADFEFRIHAFLKRNPSRAENDRHRAMRADAKDSRLRALVYERDGGCCRYCRSGPLPPNGGRNKDRRKVRSFDHVDPDKPAGPSGEGYVVACDRCNTEKGHRLPHEADMVLLDEPSEAERAVWLARDLAVFDRPTCSQVLPMLGESPSQDRAGMAPETRRDGAEPFAPGANADGDLGANPGADADAITAPSVHPEQAGSGGVGPSARSENPPGLGRAAAGSVQAANARASPRSRPQDQPPRTGTHPDIYTGRSRAPDYVWPPGSTPAVPRHRPEENDP